MAGVDPPTSKGIPAQLQSPRQHSPTTLVGVEDLLVTKLELLCGLVSVTRTRSSSITCVGQLGPSDKKVVLIESVDFGVSFAPATKDLAYSDPKFNSMASSVVTRAHGVGSA